MILNNFEFCRDEIRPLLEQLPVEQKLNILLELLVGHILNQVETPDYVGQDSALSYFEKELEKNK